MQHRFLKDWVLIGNFCLLRKTNIRNVRNVKKDLPSESLRLCSAGGRSESLTRKSFPWKQIRLWLTYAAALAGPAMLVVSEWCLTTLTLTVTNWLIWEAKMWFQGSFALKLWWFLQLTRILLQKLIFDKDLGRSAAPSSPPGRSLSWYWYSWLVSNYWALCAARILHTGILGCYLGY